VKSWHICLDTLRQDSSLAAGMHIFWGGGGIWYAYKHICYLFSFGHVHVGLLYVIFEIIYAAMMNMMFVPVYVL